MSYILLYCRSHFWPVTVAMCTLQAVTVAMCTLQAVTVAMCTPGCGSCCSSMSCQHMVSGSIPAPRYLPMLTEWSVVVGDLVYGELVGHR